jgi:hypothetical protein
MPEVASTRVKDTGRGELDYSDQNANANGISTPSSQQVASTGATSGSTGTNTVSTVNGENIGTGYGLFAGGSSGSNIMLDFKTIRAGNGITISEDGFTLTINSTANGGSSSGGANGATDGTQLDLGNVAFSNAGAVSLNHNTTVTASIESLNEILGKLVPSAPPVFPNNQTLAITNTTGNSPLLAAGVVDHANSSLSAGQPVTRVTSGPNSNLFNDMGPGNSGMVQLIVNGGITANATLTGTGDNGTFNGLVIADQKAFPVGQPGFYETIDVSFTSAPSPTGINKVKLNHTGGSSTNELNFVLDDMTSTSVISSGTIGQASLGTVAYSSSVPHYNTGGTLLVGASLSNLAGQTYYGGGDPLTITGSTGITTSQTFSYSGLGITTPIALNTLSATAIVPVILNVDGSTHGLGTISAQVKNVNGTSGLTQLSSTIILVKHGVVPAGKVDELNIPVSGLGSLPNNNNATRVTLAVAGDEPTGATSAWDATATLPIFEAAVVAGVLSNNQTNYSTGYLPSGPNLSINRNAAQYITLAFDRSAVSVFNINVTGTYAGCWIKLPNVSDNNTISPNATNGWWNAGLAYTGAGVPGNSSDSTAGCAVGSVMAGASGVYTITFGTQTSTNATSNQILVRFRLNAGQSITALSFTN